MKNTEITKRDTVAVQIYLPAQLHGVLKKRAIDGRKSLRDYLVHLLQAKAS